MIKEITKGHHSALKWSRCSLEWASLLKEQEKVDKNKARGLVIAV